MSDELKSKTEYIADIKRIMPDITDEQLAHRIHMWEHFYVIPLGKDTTVIPKGDYCYSRVEGVSKYGIPLSKRCPYDTYKEINGVPVAWCSYLELGGILNEGGTEEGYKKLIEYFGDEESLWDGLPLDLLFDQCKECGVNGFTAEEEKEMYGEWQNLQK